MQKEEAKRLFKKLKIRTLLDLALVLPSSYEDRRLSQSLEEGKEHTVEAEVISTLPSKNYTVELYLPKFREKIQAVFFKATPYHRKLFRVGASLIIRGRLKRFKGRFQITQPKSIKEFGSIIPKYKNPYLKESELKALISKYVTKSNLINEGLTPKESDTILSLHFPQNYPHLNPMQKSSYTERVLKFVEAFNHIKKLRAKRHFYPAIASLNNPLDEFISSLPFELTDDQKRAISDIQKDLSRVDRATKRIIIGDVGSGKTMVILASAVIAGDKKSILMAPTSILSRQIYQEAKKYLPKSLSIALVMQNGIEGDYKSADFIIGTHALLYLKDLPQASLVMVDEQHRFGTNQRAMLEAMVSQEERRPHYLQFSATPIPRTQAMMESEMIGVSLILSTPFEKIIHSQVIGKEDFSRLLWHIERELEANHQVLIVYPLVESSTEIPYQSIEEARGFWEKRYDGVFVTHGKDKNKEEVLERFRDEGKILLATTVIEVGISLPRLTTIVIVGAERLGLATLHQLRGRVGRNGLESWCFLYTKQKNSERLNRFCNTTDGFEIARLDLEYRASGDILDGTIQSGQKFKWLNLARDEEIIREAKRRVHSKWK